MTTSYVALVEAADPQDLAECPVPGVTVTLTSYNMVRLVGEYDALMSALTSFVGLTDAEADMLIEELA